MTIGASPDGQAETIAGGTQLESLPTGHLTDQQVLKAIGDRVSAAALSARQRIDRVAVVDPVTCDLFVQVLATLEKQLWMIRAQTVGSGRVGAGTPRDPAGGREWGRPSMTTALAESRADEDGHHHPFAIDG